MADELAEAPPFLGRERLQMAARKQSHLPDGEDAEQGQTPDEPEHAVGVTQRSGKRTLGVFSGSSAILWNKQDP